MGEHLLLIQCKFLRPPHRRAVVMQLLDLFKSNIHQPMICAQSKVNRTSQHKRKSGHVVEMRDGALILSECRNQSVHWRSGRREEPGKLFCGFQLLTSIQRPGFRQSWRTPYADCTEGICVSYSGVLM